MEDNWFKNISGTKWILGSSSSFSQYQPRILLLAFAYDYTVGILIKWDSQGKSGF